MIKYQFPHSRFDQISDSENFRKFVCQVKFLHHSPACIVECVSEYIFLISKKNESKEEKRIAVKKSDGIQ